MPSPSSTHPSHAGLALPARSSAATIAATSFAAVLALLIAILAAAPPAARAADITTQIIGGQPIPDSSTFNDDWPFLVGIILKPSSNDYQGQICGGTLVAPRLVITAAHCVKDQTTASFDILSGTRELSEDAMLPIGAHTAVSAIYIHPAYDPISQDNDIAALVLAAPAPAPAAPIRLVQPLDAARWAPSQPLEIAGWGRTAFSGTSQWPTIARSAQIPRISDSSCQANYGADFHAASMICAGTLGDSPGTGVDSCQGDSGGPLISRTAGQPTRLVGITSWGISCGSTYYGVYSRVDALRSWAQTVMDAQAQPAMSSAPAISGAAVIGSSIDCTSGSWTGASEVTDLELARNGSAVARPYAISGADIGSTFTCSQLVWHDYGQHTYTSTAAGPVPDAGSPGDPTSHDDPALPVMSAAPSITGAARAGSTLTCQTGTWLYYQQITVRWLRNGAAVSISQTYPVTAADAGRQLACEVQATGITNTPVTALSQAVTVARLASRVSLLASVRGCGHTLATACVAAGMIRVHGAVAPQGAKRAVTISISRRERVNGKLRWTQVRSIRLTANARSQWAVAIPVRSGRTYRVVARAPQTASATAATSRALLHQT